MSFLAIARAPIAAFFMFTLLSAARPQGPMQTPNHATTASTQDQDFYSLREPARCAFYAALLHHSRLRVPVGGRRIQQPGWDW